MAYYQTKTKPKCLTRVTRKNVELEPFTRSTIVKLRNFNLREVRLQKMKEQNICIKFNLLRAKENI